MKTNQKMMNGLIDTFEKDGFVFNWYYKYESHYVQAGNTSFIGIGDTYGEAWQNMIDHAEAMQDEDEYFSEFEVEDNIRKYLLSYTRKSQLREHDGSQDLYYFTREVTDSGTEVNRFITEYLGQQKEE